MMACTEEEEEEEEEVEEEEEEEVEEEKEERKELETSDKYRDFLTVDFFFASSCHRAPDVTIRSVNNVPLNVKCDGSGKGMRENSVLTAKPGQVGTGS